MNTRLVSVLFAVLSFVSCGPEVQQQESSATATAEALVAKRVHHARRTQSHGYMAVFSVPNTNTTYYAAEFNQGHGCTPNPIAGTHGVCVFWNGICDVGGSLNAGAVEFRSPHQQPVTLSPLADNTYAMTSVSSLVQDWSEVEFKAQGSTDIDGFFRELRMPALAPVTAPDWAASGFDTTPNIARAHPLAFTWTAPAGGARSGAVYQITVAESEAVNNATPRAIECRFPLESGRGTIPARALSMLNPGPAYVALSPLAEVPVDTRHRNILTSLYQSGPQGPANLE